MSRRPDDLAYFWFYSLDEANELLALTLSASDPSFSPLEKPLESAHALISRTQSLLFDAMLVYIRRTLHSMESFAEWGFEASGPVPRFSLSPQNYMKLVVEHLLVLRQSLEPYDRTEALQLTGESMTQSALEISDGIFYLSFVSGLQFVGYASQWVRSVAQATMRLVLEKVALIPKLSQFGTAQLSVDICTALHGVSFFIVVSTLVQCTASTGCTCPSSTNALARAPFR